jgi:hypothetical protein
VFQTSTALDSRLRQLAWFVISFPTLSDWTGPWLVDSIVEVKPTGKTTGEVVWEWRAWDHLVQNFEPAKANYGEVGKYPELIDVNFGGEIGFPGGGPPGPPRRDTTKKDAPKEDEAKKKREMDRLMSIG